MAPPDLKSAELLTEHFGYPPIALVDDIINAVNGIMYKCTQAVETYLNDKESKRLENLNESKDNDDDIIMANDNSVRGRLPDNEIELGTAKLETLLENAVDKNFDKLELYALRNILTVPNDLSNGGHIILNHYKDVKLDKESESKTIQLDLQINQLFKDITIQIHIKKFLLQNLKKAKKLIKLLTIYKDSLSFLSTVDSNTQISNETLTILKSLSPLNETFYYLITQTNQLYDQVTKLNTIFEDPETGFSQINTVDDERDKYLNVETLKLLKVLGLINDKPKITKLLNSLNNVDLQNEELQKQLQDKFGIKI